jgi:hypothetical protein
MAAEIYTDPSNSVSTELYTRWTSSGWRTLSLGVACNAEGYPLAMALDATSAYLAWDNCGLSSTVIPTNL